MIEIRETATEIRRLRPEDAALCREIRLEALQRNPEAFSSTFEVEAAQTQAFFADRLAASAVLGRRLRSTGVRDDPFEEPSPNAAI